MKKLLWFLFIVLLFGLGFLYLLKNPTLLPSQILLGALNIKIETTKEFSGMDLSHCVSYYDGCNTCTVKDGRPKACTVMQCDSYAESQCLEYTSGYVTGTVVTWTTSTSSIAIDTWIAMDTGTTNIFWSTGISWASMNTWTENASWTINTSWTGENTWAIAATWTTTNTWMIGSSSWWVSNQTSGNLTP